MNATMTTINVPTHATHVVCDREGHIRAWSTSEAVAVAMAERQEAGAFVATHVPFELEEAEREEAIRELEALYADTPPPPAPHEEPVDAFERVLVEAGLGWAFEEPRLRVTHEVHEEAPAKLTVGFTAGGFLAQRSRKALRRAGIALPKRISERTVANAIRTSGYEPVIVPASTL